MSSSALSTTSHVRLFDGVHCMQIADIRYTSREAFAGSALHILHRATNYIVYIATAQETGLKLLLKAYDKGKLLFHRCYA